MVLCRADTADIFRSSPWVDETVIDDKRGLHSGGIGFWLIAKKLKARHFDLAIVPHRSMRSALMAYLASIPRRIGFSASAGRFLFTQTLPFTWGMHDLERNMGLLLPLGNASSQALEQESVYIKAKAQEESNRRIQELLASTGVTPDLRLVGVHPGSVWPTKRWPQDRYAELIRQLTEQANVRVVLVGGRNDGPLAASIVQAARVPVADLTGKTSLAELMALMGRLSLFVTNDSGPMHIATASGVPTLAFFGPTTRELGFFPYGSQHKVLEVDLNCRPCGLHGSHSCPEGHFLCMRLISVDRALRTAIEMLDLGAAVNSAEGSLSTANRGDLV
jgi:heptosyltransferase-2